MTRSAGDPGVGPRASTVYRLRVSAVVAETADAYTVLLDVPPELAAVFAYQPGQFLTLRIPSDQCGSVARCYSLCSSPVTGDPHAITVKRTAGGYASHWIADNIRPGTELDVLPPAGMFTPASLDHDLLLLAAGSGITPVLSILKSALAVGHGRIVLVYANRDQDAVIFAAELRRMAAAAGPRLLVVHWLDSVQGTPTAAGLYSIVRPFAGFQIFACGPDPFLAVAREAAAAAGVPPRGVKVERFASLADNPFEEPERPADGGIAAALTVTLDGEVRSLAWPAGMRMLDVLIEAGLDAPYSCREGVCGACACQLSSGQVEMAHNAVLDEADLADGYILACQSLAASPEISISY